MKPRGAGSETRAVGGHRFVLGIDQEPGSAGFQRPVIRPHPGGSLRWARGSYQSVRGLVRSEWQLDADPGAAAMAEAISAGYRLQDTAAKYGNEWAVGEAIRRSGAARQDPFIIAVIRGSARPER